MIITRTPFRVSFCGGGSDLAAYYEKHEGCVLSTAINKYMYISIHPAFDPGQIVLKYSQNETVDRLDAISHRIFRCVLEQFGAMGVEITSTADVPAGTGLGSSSAFTVGLLNALNAYYGKETSKDILAENACDVEINRLGAPIGKQDQYASAFGGLNLIHFLPNGKTVVEPVRIKSETLAVLERRLVMFYTGDMRDANGILAEQKANISADEKSAGLARMCALARELKAAAEADDLDAFGQALDANWRIKREMARGITNPDIDSCYSTAMANGAGGGKLLGAGGGGFLLFYCREEDQPRLRAALKLREFPFRFDQQGTQVIYRDNGCYVPNNDAPSDGRQL